MVNDTRVTIDDAYSFHPSIGVDNQGNTHIAWMDGRDYGFEKDELRNLIHQPDLGCAWDGAGRPLHLCHQEDQRHADFKLRAERPPPASPSQNRFSPLLTDDQNNVHIAWVDWQPSPTRKSYTRLNQRPTGDGLTASDPEAVGGHA